MDGSTIGLIAMGAIIGGILVGVIGRATYLGKMIDIGYIGIFSKVLYYFLPYSLFLFGIIYDGLVRKITFFPAGFIGLFTVYINWGLSSLIKGSTVADSDICGLPGMSNLGSDLAPQNIVFAATVMTYIAAYISSSQPIGSSYSGMAWLGVFIVWAIQLFMYYMNGCYDAKISSNWIGSFAGSITPPVYGLMLGMLIGGLSGYGFSNLKGDSPGIGLSAEQKQSVTSSAPAMGSTSSSSGAGKCSATDSDDQFVCEAYKNGELVTSTIVE